MLSFENDEWIRDFRESNPIWIAGLSDGTSVYYDDARFGPNTWLRLKEHCARNSLSITTFRFGFRSNMFNLLEGQDGYFFCRGVRGDFGATKTLNYWLLGYVMGDTVLLRKWHVPEMLPLDVEKRLIKDCSPECLILK